MKILLTAIACLALGGCSEEPSGGPTSGFAEEIELESGKLYHLKFSGTDYEFSVGDEGFSVMRIDKGQDAEWSPFSAILRDGNLFYEVRTTDGNEWFYVQDVDGDGLADKRLTYPKQPIPGTSARIERITHEFTLEQSLTLPPSEQGGALCQR